MVLFISVKLRTREFYGLTNSIYILRMRWTSVRYFPEIKFINTVLNKYREIDETAQRIELIHKRDKRYNSFEQLHHKLFDLRPPIIALLLTLPPLHHTLHHHNTSPLHIRHYNIHHQIQQLNFPTYVSYTYK